VLHPKGFPQRDGQPQVMIIRKSDGGFLYATTDLAAARFRIHDLHADRIIYVTDARQADHFAMLFWALREAGWASKPTRQGEGSASSPTRQGEGSAAADVRLDHVPFGTVLGPDKKPLKARAGEAVKLRELLDEAVERAMKVMEEKNPALSPAQRQQIARAVGIGALKYADLSSDRIKDYIFDWDRMLAFDGNTAPYIQNAYVRVHGIFRKGHVNVANLAGATIVVAEPAEKALALKLLQLAGVVAGVADSLEPHRLCTWLYETASAYHKFFETCPVLAAESDAVRSSRLRLCEVTARAFKLGLGLLGIEVVERM
jgi:arginyl-tRNA synthetase